MLFVRLDCDEKKCNEYGITKQRYEDPKETSITCSVRINGVEFERTVSKRVGQIKSYVLECQGESRHIPKAG
jgi:hypothetical protein